MRNGAGLLISGAIVGVLLAACADDKAVTPRVNPGPSAAGTLSPSTPECLIDGDKDGFCDHAFSTSAMPDCDDFDAARHPGATEVANAADDNCDGQIDEGLSAACVLTIEAPAGGCETPTQIVSSGASVCALADSGRVFCWGKNAAGTLGTPDLVNAPVPIAVPGIAGATALVAARDIVCARADDNALCWGGGSAFPFVVALPPNTTQIAVGSRKQQDGSLAHTLYALDDSGQSWLRALFLKPPATTLNFAKGTADVKELVGGGESICFITAAGALQSGADLSLLAPQVDFATIGLNGSLCYRANGDLYCGPDLAAGAVVAGNGSAVGVASNDLFGCAFNEAGKLACWTAQGPKTVNDAAQLALGWDFGCVLRKSGKISCWGSTDGGTLGDGRVRPGSEPEPVDLLAGPELALPPIVLLSATPGGACDSLQDLSFLVGATSNVHGALSGCKAQCETRLDSAECFGTCAMATGLSNACFGCYVALASCQGADCYQAFQACAGYPVDFARALSNEPRFECVGAGCLRGKSVGQACAPGEACLSGSCSKLPQAPDTQVCAAANGSFCYKDSPYCSCQLGTVSNNGWGYCGGCYGEGRIASGNGDCLRDCSQESFCAAGQSCRYFSNSMQRYCDPN